MNTYLKIALRNLYRDKVYAAINIAGLAMALCCCLIVALYLRNELTYDLHNTEHKKIFRVASETTINGTANSSTMTSGSLGALLKKNYPEVKDYVHFSSRGNTNLRYGDVAYNWEHSFAATENVFEYFTHRVIYGDPKTALIDPLSMAVSETFAKKYFGDTNPIGKVMIDEEDATRKISLVFADLPDNSHLKYDILFRFNGSIFMNGKLMKSEDLPASEQRWMLWNVSVMTYLILPANYNVADYAVINDDFYQKNMASEGQKDGKSWRSWLQPLASIYLYSDVANGTARGNRFYLFGFAAVGIFILLVACINYINLSTARASKQARSVGMRKILGANRSVLMMQFMGEALFFAGIAAAIGIVLTEIILTLSPLNSLIGKHLTLDLMKEPTLTLWVIACSLLVGVLSGLYPALYLSSWAPLAAMVKSNAQGKNTIRFRQTLIFLQFSISIAVITCTLIMAAQMRFIANKSLGFAKENRLTITLRGLDLIDKAPVIINDLSGDSHILGATAHNSWLKRYASPGRIEVEGAAGAMQRIQVSTLSVDNNFFSVMGMQMVAGRDFSKKLLTDTGLKFVVNESFVRKMGWTDPIGKNIKYLPMGRDAMGKVIGVVADFNFKSLHSPMEPLIIKAYQDDYGFYPEILKKSVQHYMTVKISGDDVSQTIRMLQDKFAKVDPTHAFEFKFIDDTLNELYKSEQNVMKLIGIFALICMVIASMGLFGLAMFTTEQRTKEIGIRKVLGASTQQIITLLSRNILLLVVAGAVVASIIAYLAMNEWLASFAYRAAINPLIFIVSTLVATVVAYLTIALQSYKTATANPVVALRYE